MPIGPTELIIVLLIILFLFGAGKLPEVGRGLGQSIRELRGALKEGDPAAEPRDARGSQGAAGR